ncbi:MAG: FAD:protein FMN transferase [Bacteroidales bacterium]|nr:FAD:protein FMN transferase [Bacteroidales bacterium]
MVRFQGAAQGTYYDISYFDNQERNFQKEIDSLLDAFNFSVSVYEPNSIISKINRDETDTEADDWFITVFRKAYEVAEATDGYFDFSVGPLVNAWGFGFSDRLHLDRNTIDSLLKLVGYRNFKLENNRIIKAVPGAQIDFNAIAKGYAVDVVAQFIESKGVSRYLVDIGGEVIAHGRKPNGTLWKVGVEKPSEDQNSSRELKAIVELENMAIATSGNYRRFYIEDGVRYSHTIDPFTGYPVQHSLLSVSVLAEDCMTADAYATAFMVMGVEKTIEFLKIRKDLEAFLIYSENGEELQTWISEGFRSKIVERK